MPEVSFPLSQPRIMGEEQEYSVCLDKLAETDKPVGDYLLQSAANSVMYHSSGILARLGIIKTDKGFLTNGARFYPDMGQFLEYATPEATTLHGLLVARDAGRRIIQMVMSAYYRNTGTPLQVYNRTAFYDRSNETVDAMTCRPRYKLFTAGTHENYNVPSEWNQEVVTSRLAALFATRALITGPGMVRPDPELGNSYELDQKTEDLGSDITSRSSTFENKKPFVILRDEHFDSKRARFQVALGSANMFPFGTMARFAMTSLALRMISCNRLPSIGLVDPIVAARTTSKYGKDGILDTTRRKNIKVIDVQYEFASAAAKMAQKEAIPEDEAAFTQTWLELLNAIDSNKLDPWIGCIEWYAKQKLLEAHLRRKNTTIDSDEALAFDLQWHRIYPVGMFDKLCTRLDLGFAPSEDAVRLAIRTAPDNTRARARGKAIRYYGDRIRSGETLAINWDSWPDPKDVYNAHQHDPYDHRTFTT